MLTLEKTYLKKRYDGREKSVEVVPDVEHSATKELFADERESKHEWSDKEDWLDDGPWG